jgi:hypothetical protein
MAVSIPSDLGRLGKNFIMIQRQDQRNTERHVGADIDPSDPGPLYFRAPTTLEMANSIGRYRSLLDKYENSVAT